MALNSPLTWQWPLWPKISFPGASPMRAKQRDHNKSPPPRHECDWATCGRFLSLSLSQKPITQQPYQNTGSCQTLYKKERKEKKNVTLPLLSLSLPVKSFYKYCGMRLCSWMTVKEVHRDASLLHFPGERTPGSGLEGACSAKQQTNLHQEN